MSDTTRLRALTEAGLLHPNPDAVFAPLFTGGSGFFLAADKVQVKYEMLRAHLVDGLPVTEAAAAHGYSRAAFYLVAAAFEQSGMAGLLDERRGRRGPVKLRPEIVDFIRAEDRVGGADRRAGRRPVRGGVAPAHHRAGARSVSARSFWPPVEAAQVDYETLRAQVLEPCRAARGSGRGPVRPPRPGRVDRVAGGRAGVRRRTLGAARPAWTPHDDPRVAALAAGYQFLLDAAARVDSVAATGTTGRGLR